MEMVWHDWPSTCPVSNWGDSEVSSKRIPSSELWITRRAEISSGEGGMGEAVLVELARVGTVGPIRIGIRSIGIATNARKRRRFIFIIFTMSIFLGETS